MKKLICVAFALFAIALPIFAVDVSAESAIVLDCYTGKIIYEKNADEKRSIASTTKIMTGLLASEIYNIDEEVVIKPEWCGIEGSSMYLTAGERLKIIDLIYGLMLASGNDAATALASLKEDSIDFIDLMNSKAAEIGLHNTNFENPSGLDSENHYSTARDMAILTQYALKNEYFAKICSTKQGNIGNRFMANHNKLLFMIKGCIGVKTGYTDDSGRCLVSAVERNGRQFIAVTLNAPDDWEDHKKLYKIAFNDIKERTVVKKGLIGYIDVAGKGTTPVYIKNDFSAYLSQDELDRIEVSLKGQRIVYGGFSADEQYGVLTIRLDDKIIHTESVYFRDTVDADTPLYSMWERIILFFSKR